MQSYHWLNMQFYRFQYLLCIPLIGIFMSFFDIEDIRTMYIFSNTIYNAEGQSEHEPFTIQIMFSWVWYTTPLTTMLQYFLNKLSRLLHRKDNLKLIVYSKILFYFEALSIFCRSCSVYIATTRTRNATIEIFALIM